MGDHTDPEQNLRDFYVRYYVGHRGRYGHEYLEFEITNNGLLRYANNSNYKKEGMIKKEMFVNGIVLAEMKKIVLDSTILSQNDAGWPKADRSGRQELEVIIGDKHVSFTTFKIGTMAEIEATPDPAGLTVLHYVCQDLKALVLSLVGMHFKIKPV